MRHRSSIMGLSVVLVAVLSAASAQAEGQPTVEAAEAFRSAGAAEAFAAGRHGEVVALSEAFIVAFPQFHQTASQLLGWRARSFSSLGDHARALSSAKAGFCVAGMEGVSPAIEVLEACLVASDPSAVRALGIPGCGTGPDAARKLKLDLIADLNAEAPTGGVSVYERIRVNEPWVEPALSDRSGDWYGHRLERGNLLLIAGRPDAAMEELQAAYEIGPEDQLAAMTESIARAMKAQDGGVRRCNAWLRDLKP